MKIKEKEGAVAEQCHYKGVMGGQQLTSRA
jgi:hypothetical protein